MIFYLFNLRFIQKFDYSQSNIGRLLAYFGVISALVQGGLVRRFAKKYKPQSVLKFSILFMALSLISILESISSNSLYSRNVFNKEKGLILGRERKDNYVNDLVKFAKKDGSRNDALVERLLFAAMIEARSCERFKVLSENIQDPELAKFYRDLMISEAGHYTTFLGFAKKYQDNINVDTRWKEWIEYESSIIANYGNRETVHG